MRTEFCSIEIFFNILEYHKWNIVIFVWLGEFKALFFSQEL